MEHIESLPRRVFLDATLLGNVLTVSPPPKHGNERISVFRQNEIQIGVYVRPMDLSQPPISAQFFDAASIGSVLINPHSGSDIIRYGIAMRCTINGGDGSDRIFGVGGPATINGDSGSDVIMDGIFS